MAAEAIAQIAPGGELLDALDDFIHCRSPLAQRLAMTGAVVSAAALLMLARTSPALAADSQSHDHKGDKTAAAVVQKMDVAPVKEGHQIGGTGGDGNGDGTGDGHGTNSGNGTLGRGA